MNSKQFNLRLHDTIDDTPLLNRKIIFQGSLKKCNQYAQKHGFIFKKDNSLFGGYFAHPHTGHCLYIT